MTTGTVTPVGDGPDAELGDRRSSRSLAISIALLVFALAAVALQETRWSIPVRPVVVAMFIAIGPGSAILRLWSLASGWAGLGLAIATSISLAMITSGGMLYAGAWSPFASLAVLAGVTVLACVLSLVRSQYSRPVASPSPSFAPLPGEGRAAYFDETSPDVVDVADGVGSRAAGDDGAGDEEASSGGSDRYAGDRPYMPSDQLVRHRHPISSTATGDTLVPRPHNGSTQRVRALVAQTRQHADASSTGASDTLTWLLFLAGTGVSRLGERLELPWLIYNPFLFGWFHLVSVRVAPGFYRAMRTVFPDARRFADVGAGSGGMAAHGRALGLSVVACEYSPFGRLFARLQGVRSLPFDVETDSPSKLGPESDVAYCIEVAEHLSADLGDRLVSFLGGAAPLVVFAAAHPGQGGQGHVNEQPREYWIERFEARGMMYLPDHTARLRGALSEHLTHGRWITENAMVFGRGR